MNESDKTQFKSAFMGMAEIYGKEVTQEMLKLYWAMLQDITVDQFSDAVAAHMRDTECGAFFPKPADILKKVDGTARERYLKKIYDLDDVSWAEGLQGRISNEDNQRG